MHGGAHPVPQYAWLRRGLLVLALTSLAAATTAACAAGAHRGEPEAKIRIGGQPGLLLSAAGSLWTTDLALGRVVRIDPASNRIKTRLRVSTRPFGLAYGAGSVWVADRSLNTLARINPRTNKVSARIKIGYDAYGLTFAAGSAWVTSESDGTVRRISPKRNRVVAKIKVGTTPNGLAFAFGSLWVANLGSDDVVRIDPATNRVTQRIGVEKADWVTPSSDELWVSSEAGFVARIDPTTGSVERVTVGANPLASAWVDGELWVPNLDERTVSVVDPSTRTVRTTIAVGDGPLAVLVAGSAAWVSHPESGELWRLPATRP